MIRRFVGSHKFFISESKTYIDKWDLFHILYYPVAYCKYMYLTMRY